MHVLIAVADVGSGVQLEEALNRAGFAARWDAGEVDGPRAGGDRGQLQLLLAGEALVEASLVLPAVLEALLLDLLLAR